jgi:hypothetical protein
MISVIVILVSSIHEWMQVLGGRKPIGSTEIPFTPRPSAPPAAAATVRA